MQTHTVFTLLDGSKHDNINRAKEYCLEQMGAETRAMLQDILSSSPAMVQVPAMKLVIDKKYDKAINLYVSWRKEHDALTLYENSPESEEV